MKIPFVSPTIAKGKSYARALLNATKSIEERYRDMDPVFFDLYRACSPYTMTSIERMYAIYTAINYIVKHNIAGDIVECGVWRGGSCMMAIFQLQRLGDTSRKVYLYDTFKGMPVPTEADVRHDGQRIADRWETQKEGDHNAWDYASFEDVKHNVQSTGYPESHIHYVQGRVEDTIPAQLPGAIALLRLDTDWYESTKHELIHLYPLLVSRGVLIIDDYGHWRGSRDAVDEYMKEQNLPLLLHRLDYTGRVAVK